MKYLIKSIVLLLTWPFVLLGLLVMSLVWLILYCWGHRDDDFMATDEVKSLAYHLWHFKKKEA